MLVFCFARIGAGVDINPYCLPTRGKNYKERRGKKTWNKTVSALSTILYARFRLAFRPTVSMRRSRLLPLFPAHRDLCR